MFDVGLSEMLVVIIVALVVVGPKDLPKVVRTIARAVARLRRMVDEFMVSVNDYIRESELADLKEAMDKTRTAVDVKGHLKNMIDPTGELSKPVEVTEHKAVPPPVEDPVEEPAAPEQQDGNTDR